MAENSKYATDASNLKKKICLLKSSLDWIFKFLTKNAFAYKNKREQERDMLSAQMQTC